MDGDQPPAETAVAGEDPNEANKIQSDGLKYVFN